jgi:hypothetical protein
VRSAPARPAEPTAKLRIAALLFGSSLLLVAATHAGAAPAVVYDNTNTMLTDSQFNPGQFEFGDQIALGGTSRVVTAFQFAYQLVGGDGNETATVRFYANDGSAGAPGTKLFESKPISIFNTGGVFAAGSLVNLDVSVPSSFTWSVLFGNTTGDTATTGIFNPPIVGSSDPSFYWIKQNDQWSKASFGSAGPANFFARVTADVVPEPSTGLLLAAGLLALVRRRRPAFA